MQATTMDRPRDWREARRLRAWELKQQGWQQQTIAPALGVSPGAVSQWLTRAAAGGVEALREAVIRLCSKPEVIRGCVRESGYSV